MSERIYEKFGIDIGLFQIRLTFSAKSRWVSNISSIRRFKAWYKFGTILSLILMVPAFTFLVINLVKLISLTMSEKHQISNQELIFQPVIPGVTFPLSDLRIYGFSLFLSTVFHELGHALAADCHDIKIFGYGLFIFILIPAAFVDLSTPELKSISYMEQLKIYTAGVYHNLILAVVSFILMVSLPYLSIPLYEKNEGIMILSIRNSSSVSGPSGLRIGHIITEVNECKVSNISDFYTCLRYEANILPSYCVNIDGKNCEDCCIDKYDNGSFLNWSKAGQIKDTANYCLSVREVLTLKSKRCKYFEDCNSDMQEYCLSPKVSFPNESLWVMPRKGQKDFLFIGSLSDIHFGIESVTDYLPKYDTLKNLSLSLPVIIEKILYYTTSFSLALGLINIVPCVMLDGQHATRALCGLCFDSNNSYYSHDRISNWLVYSGSILLFTNLCISLFVMQWL